MALTNEIIRQKLTEKFGEELTGWEEPYGMLTFTSHKDLNLKVFSFFMMMHELKFQFFN